MSNTNIKQKHTLHQIICVYGHENAENITAHDHMSFFFLLQYDHKNGIISQAYLEPGYT